MNESDVESMKSLDQTKEEYIFDVLRKCKSNPTAFSLPLDAYFPKLDKNFFEIEEKEIDETIEIYSNQCAAIFDTGMINDKTIIEMLAIGQKNGVKYLQHLVDMFCRDRIKYHLQTLNIKCRSLDVNQWSGSDSKHFEELRKIAPNKVDLIKSSVNSYFKRICPKLLLSETWRIRDSCEESTNYVCSAIIWIHKLATSRKECTPFQMDFIVGYQKAKWDQIIEPEQMRRDPKDLYDEKEKEDDGNNQLSDDDDDDDDNDNDNVDNVHDGFNNYQKKKKYRDPSVTYFDCMGDLKQKCKINGLRHIISKIDYIEDDSDDRAARIFDISFKKFEQELKNQNDQKYPRFKRFISFLDRRQKGNDNYDELILYEPPGGSRNIPHNYVPLWFLGASRSCLIPNIEYDGDENDAANAVHLNVIHKMRQIDNNQYGEYQYKLAKCISKIQVKNGMDFDLIIRISLERYCQIKVHRCNEPISYKLKEGPKPYKFAMKNEYNLNKKYKSLKDRLKNSNITSESHCKGGMLLLSFHVEASNIIKCYLFYQGQIARFMPEDIINIFPKLFCQTFNHGQNRKWWESGKAKEYYEKIKDKLPDIRFEAFCNVYGSHYHPRPRDSKEELEQREKQKNIFLLG